ncbi:hypothetical protein T12_2122 [Trichinella patagoniensis]|uniref:G-protein coupled receptors family 1 profile domain-containing protein n=1 Tax=Trichinella patagoniensis TaxID=990121 RepID=A0A0V1A936_9BILA|nr:hypothetical protein T12_2122 [Trichinella patagoniensis]
MKIDRMRRKENPLGWAPPQQSIKGKAKRTVDVLLLALYPFWLKRTKEVRPNTTAVVEASLVNITSATIESDKETVTAFSIVICIFSAFAALTNSMLFTAISMKASKKNADKFNLSSAVSGITYLCANIARMMNDCTVHLTTPWMCLIGHPQVTLFAVCEPASTAGMFLMALDCSITVVCFKPAKWSIMKKNVNCFIIITFSCIAVGVATMWIVVFFRTQTHVLACCYFEDVLPFHMYVANYVILSSFGYCSVILFLVSFISLNLRKINSEAVRLIRMKRQNIIVKQTISLVTFGFLVQTVPSTAAVVGVYYSIESFLLDVIWIICIISYSAYAVFLFCKRKDLRNNLYKMIRANHWVEPEALTNNMSTVVKI